MIKKTTYLLRESRMIGGEPEPKLLGMAIGVDD
jgi:hypothetical protein